MRGCCCRGDDDVDGSTHVVDTNSDRAGREPPVGRSSYYTLDDVGGIVTDGVGQGARRYLLELVTVHVRNVYDPSTYRDGVIEQIIYAFHSLYPMPEHLAVSSVWLRRIILSHIVNRRSGYTRAARAVLDREAAGLPPRDDGGWPRTVHDAEWRAALARGAQNGQLNTSLHVRPK
jgi:DNA-directed RNA polymerase specialized sigma24 family protein